MKIDLHVHTEESDGVFSAREVALMAKEKGVDILAITDHESTRGIKEAQESGSLLGLEVIPGVELLTVYHEHEVHLLGYYRDIDNPELQKHLKKLRERRTAQTYKMVKILQQDGITLRWPDVEREASSEGTVSKAHIMRAMYNRDLFPENFSWREIGAMFQPGGIAYLPFRENRFEDAVDFIYATGGMPVLAHPGILRRPEIVPELLSYRPIGLEVYYGYWYDRQALISYYEALAREKALIATGGSDFHGPFSQVKIGEIDVSREGIQTMKTYLGLDREERVRG